MKAVVLTEYGGFDKLRMSEVQLPEIGAGEILIRNRAVGVNHCDTDVRRGVFGVAETFPHVMGVDCAGDVVSVGAGVEGFAEGDRVAPHFLLTCGGCRNCVAGRENICLRAGILGVTTWGTYAQFMKVPARNAVRLPDALSYIDAVAAQVPFATAWEALIEVGRLARGEAALVNAAGSGVGSAGVQIAKLAGARVIATTGSDEKFAAARELSADAVINYETTHVGDAVMRLTGGVGVELAKFRPVIAATFALADAAAARQMMESRRFFGRIVMDPWRTA